LEKYLIANVSYPVSEVFYLKMREIISSALLKLHMVVRENKGQLIPKKLTQRNLIQARKRLNPHTQSTCG
jgi:hypothetical protein